MAATICGLQGSTPPYRVEEQPTEHFPQLKHVYGVANLSLPKTKSILLVLVPFPNGPRRQEGYEAGHVLVWPAGPLPSDGPPHAGVNGSRQDLLVSLLPGTLSHCVQQRRRLLRSDASLRQLLAKSLRLLGEDLPASGFITACVDVSPKVRVSGLQVLQQVTGHALEWRVALQTYKHLSIYRLGHIFRWSHTLGTRALSPACAITRANRPACHGILTQEPRHAASCFHTARSSMPVPKRPPIPVEGPSPHWRMKRLPKPWG